jgi:hypothetical protein
MYGIVGLIDWRAAPSTDALRTVGAVVRGSGDSDCFDSRMTNFCFPAVPRKLNPVLRFLDGSRNPRCQIDIRRDWSGGLLRNIAQAPFVGVFEPAVPPRKIY